MSITKRTEGYARHMDEVFRDDDRDYHLEYAEWRYLQEEERKAQLAKHHEGQNQQVNQPKGTTPTQR